MTHLTEKMESPFMRLVEVENTVGQVTFDELPLPIQFDSIPRFNFWKRRAFVAAPGKPRDKAWFFYVKGDHYEEILKLIQEKDNIVFGKSDFLLRANHPAAIVITKDLASRIDFEYPDGDGLIEINQFSTSVDNNERGIRFQVAAIVEKLPQNADAIFTEAAWSILHADRDEPEYTNRFKKKCFLVSASDTTAAQEKYAIRNMEGAATFQESYVVTLYANSSNDQWQEVEFIPKT